MRAEAAERNFAEAANHRRSRCVTAGMSTDALPLPDLALLPDDPAVLKQLVVQLMEELQKARERLERQEHHMHLLLKRLYGSTSEKFDPRQGVLFDAQALSLIHISSRATSPPAARRSAATSTSGRPATSTPQSFAIR